MSAEPIWDVAEPFVEVVLVGPEHLDRFAHANNVSYLGWIERVIWAHSVSLGLDFEAYERIGVGCVVRRHELDYLAPTFAGDRLRVATWIAENDGRVAMWRGYRIIREGDGKTILRGRSYFVCIDMKSGRPRRQPPEFVAAYRPAIALAR